MLKILIKMATKEGSTTKEVPKVATKEVSTENNNIKNLVITNNQPTWFFNFDRNSIITRQREDFEYLTSVNLSRLIYQAKMFYTQYKTSYKYGINKYTFRLWKETPGVGKYFREFIANAPLIVVLTQLVNERKKLKEYYMIDKDDDNDNFMNTLLGKKVEKDSIFENKELNHFCQSYNIL